MQHPIQPAVIGCSGTNRAASVPEVRMAAENSSSNVASVAIVVIIIVAIFAFYFLFGRGISGKRDINIDVDIPDKIGQTSVEFSRGHVG
jgi:hypothetical protein